MDDTGQLAKGAAQKIVVEIERILPNLDKCGRNLPKVEALAKKLDKMAGLVRCDFTKEEQDKYLEERNQILADTNKLDKPFQEARPRTAGVVSTLYDFRLSYLNEFTKLGDVSDLLILTQPLTPPLATRAAKELRALKSRLLKAVGVQVLAMVPETARSTENPNGTGPHSDQSKGTKRTRKKRGGRLTAPERVRQSLLAVIDRRNHSREDAAPAIRISPTTLDKFLGGDESSGFYKGTLEKIQRYIDAAPK